MKHEHVNERAAWFDFTKPITCPACINLLWDQRDALCAKYGWTEWPEALNKGRDFIPSREETQ